jgi:hypothetical protein
MKGELFFYQNVPENITMFFPKLIDYNKTGESLEITIEYITGIPLYFLYKNKLFTEKHINSLFDMLHQFHTTEYPITIDNDRIHNNYFKKLHERFNNNDYYFTDAQEVFDRIILDLNVNYSPKVVGIIHGDFWFSNILLEYDDNYKCIDMKGQVDNELSLNGDMYYDYGKLYQSILGYDLVLNNCSIDNKYITANKEYFITKCRELNLNVDYLTAVTKSLIFGTLHSVESDVNKQNIWNFLKSL